MKTISRTSHFYLLPARSSSSQWCYSPSPRKGCTTGLVLTWHDRETGRRREETWAALIAIFDPSGWGKDFTRFSSQVLLPCSLHCCALPRTPVVSLPDPIWKVTHARDALYSLGRICGSSGRKGSIHFQHSARLQQWLCTACSRNQTRNSSAKTSHEQWRCQQQKLRSHVNYFYYWFTSIRIFLPHTKAFFFFSLFLN